MWIVGVIHRFRFCVFHFLKYDYDKNRYFPFCMLHNILYYPEKDQFIDLSSGTLLSHEDLDFIREMEVSHRESLPSYTLKELIEIFPTAIPAARRGINASIKRIKEAVAYLDVYREKREKAIENINIFDRPPYIEDINNDILNMIAETDKALKAAYYQLEQLNFIEKEQKGLTVKKATNKITDEDVTAARRIPIINFIKVRRDGKAVCLFHGDKSPSMHVYKDNHFYCFTCNKKGDVLDIIQKLHGTSFHDSIRFLIGKTI